MPFLPITLSALSAFFLGFIWYTVIFAKPWQRELGMKYTDGKGKTPNMAGLLIGSLLLEVGMAIVLSMLIPASADWISGLQTGLMIGFGCVALAFGVNYLFEGKSFTFWLINAGYNVLVFAVMGMIIGAL